MKIIHALAMCFPLFATVAFGDTTIDSVDKYAYGANIGRINFGWATSGDPDRPRVDLSTGEFSGFAYAANIGWINLGAGSLATDALFCVDNDLDGMSDAWETLNFGDTTTKAFSVSGDIKFYRVVAVKPLQ